MKQISFTDLYQMSPQELRTLGKDMEIKLAPNAGKETLIESIATENAKREQRLKAKVAASLQQEATSKLKLDDTAGKRPAPEDVAILASKRFYVRFTNTEQPADGPEPGATVEFCKGTFRFALYDGRLHCLPGVLLAEDVGQVPNAKDALVNFFRNAGLPMEANRSQPGARDMAIGVLTRLSLMGQMTTDPKQPPVGTSATYPIFSDSKLPTGETVSQLSGRRKRWGLDIISEAKPDTPFGIVTDEKELSNARHSSLVPLG